jgi:hypothetical protein
MKDTKAKRDRLEKMVEERTAYWQNKRPGWTKQPVAYFQSPLKQIRERCKQEVRNEDGTTTTTLNPVYYMAKDFARIGDGKSVRLILQTLLTA